MNGHRNTPDSKGLAIDRETQKRVHDAPVVNVMTITREEFRCTAPLAQSFAGQAARHGVTTDGRSLDYRPERDPTPEEIRELTIFWLTMAESHLDLFTIYSGHKRFADSGFLGMETQWDLERSLKGLLATNTGPDRLVCFLTTFSEAYRRHEPMPKLSGPEWEAVRHCLAPAVNALLAEALARFGVVREDLRRERSSSGEPG